MARPGSTPRPYWPPTSVRGCDDPRGGQHDHDQQQSERVGHGEPLPAVELLPGVVATGVGADGLGALDALGVDQPGGRFGAAALLERTTYKIAPTTARRGCFRASTRLIRR
jgi:hypothetical protein